MNVSLDRPSVLRPRRSGSSMAGLVFFLAALVLFPAPVFAAPLALRHVLRGRLHPRDDSSSDGSITMNIWIPILVISVVFVLFSLCTCVRRCAQNDVVTSTRVNRAAGSASTNGDAAGTTTTGRPRRRPQRTPSQISTKSLPPYMKEPGDQELVLFRGPAEADDDQAPPHVMPVLTEDDEEHSEMRNEAFDVPLNRIDSVDTMADSSTTNLIRRASASVPRPPELHHATTSRGHRRSGDVNSMDSAGSEAELLGHQRSISVDNRPDPRGEAPAYSQAVEDGMTTIILNDPVNLNGSPPNPVVPAPSHVADPAVGRGRSRLSFLMHNPFSSGNASSNVNPPQHSVGTESPTPTLHTRNGSALSRFSSRDSHMSHHSRTSSGNIPLSRAHSRSNSNLFRVFRSHSPGLQAGGSTISLDNISAPLTHTATRAEFHAPKKGLTPEQIKLITSREALEKFGVPYGPDAVAAFSLSRERPPPEFESVAGEHQGEGSENGAAEVVGEANGETPGMSESPRSTSISSGLNPEYSLLDQPDAHAGSHAMVTDEPRTGSL